MVESDFGTFDRAFGRVCGAFRLRLTVAEREELTRTYFRVLEPYELGEVLAVGRVCLEKYKRFPLVAEWLMELTETPHSATAAAPPEARQITASELEELAAAERARYAGPACDCLACVDAGVTDRPVRFVPTVIGDGHDRAYHPLRKRLELVGHWAHGEELRRWYVARDAFFASAPRRWRHVVSRELEPVGVGQDREPGEDG